MNSIQVIKALNRGGAEMLLYTYFLRKDLKKRQLCVLSGINLAMLEDFQKVDVEIYIFRICMLEILFKLGNIYILKINIFLFLFI